MIPPTPMQLTMFGSALYGGLYFGLCRALAAPWLDPRWLVCASERPRAPSASPPVAAICQDGAKARAAAPRSSQSGGGQVIDVPPSRWRGRRARNAQPAADR